MSLLLLLCVTALACERIVEEEEEAYSTNADVLNWNISVMPHFFYPSSTLNDSEKQMVNHLYEGLTRVVDGQITMGMAKTIDISSDELTYTIELKTSKWSDGELVKADDFIYSWERDDYYSRGVNLLYLDAYIKRVSVDSLGRLVIDLYEKNDNLLYQLSHVAFMPLRRDIIDFDDEIPEHRNAVSNGPYYLSAYEDEKYLILKRNTYHYDFFNVKINTIHVTLDHNYASVLQKVGDGDIHFSDSVDWKKIDDYLVNEPTFYIFENKRYYGFTINKKNEVLSKIKMRELLFAAVDRTAFNPFQNHITDSLAVFNSDHVDGEKIRQLLEELDYNLIKSLDGLRIVTRDTTNDMYLGKMLKESFSAYLGIECQVVSLNSTDYYNALKDFDYDVVLNRMYDNSDSKKKVYNYYQNNQDLNLDLDFDQAFPQSVTAYDDSSLMLGDDQFKKSYLYLPLFRGHDTVLISQVLSGWSMSDEGLFYFANSEILQQSDQEKGD